MGVGDQVFGVGTNDDDEDDVYNGDRFSVVYRTGVTASDLSGKTWKRVTAAVVADCEAVDDLQRRTTRPISMPARSSIIDGEHSLDVNWHQCDQIWRKFATLVIL